MGVTDWHQHQGTYNTLQRNMPNMGRYSPTKISARDCGNARTNCRYLSHNSLSPLSLSPFSRLEYEIPRPRKY